MAILFAWHRTLGLGVDRPPVDTRKAELFYWVTILFSQTLGTALGDWVADPGPAGAWATAAARCCSPRPLAVVARCTSGPACRARLLFWAAFILTRPLGATVGDFLDKPLANGGLALSRYAASGALVAAMLVLIFLLPQRAERITPSAR